MQAPGGEIVWRQRAERLAEQLEILRMAHASVVRRDREQRAAAKLEAARAQATPRYVVRAWDGGVLYRGPSRRAALIAAHNVLRATPWASVTVFDGEAVIWTSRRS
jgi:hypothetical protein